MPSPTLPSRLNDLATSFADAVLAAIRSASLDELQELDAPIELAVRGLVLQVRDGQLLEVRALPRRLGGVAAPVAVG